MDPSFSPLISPIITSFWHNSFIRVYIEANLPFASHFVFICNEINCFALFLSNALHQTTFHLAAHKIVTKCVTLTFTCSMFLFIQSSMEQPSHLIFMSSELQQNKTSFKYSSRPLNKITILTTRYWEKRVKILSFECQIHKERKYIIESSGLIDVKIDFQLPPQLLSRLVTRWQGGVWWQSVSPVGNSD